eukprot:gnl/MRDRNA2_/MRDRNA2_49021_c0_seq1.p1 gnl/MRDRNA2_/MRDRNA2_49021_c0~~gnl/MRDRNA2_/MRDRNA2_49021_c0_seq1.p1  ORF type:complete len:178 (+),score=18.62 gnl/MRDRNA2_/MRDRNA2_49021_c0_seq1:29-535(+)
MLALQLQLAFLTVSGGSSCILWVFRGTPLHTWHRTGTPQLSYLRSIARRVDNGLQRHFPAMPKVQRRRPAFSGDCVEAECKEDQPILSSCQDCLQAESSEDQALSINITAHQRRSLLLSFVCNVCGARTSVMINPHAYYNGMVIATCANCNAMHQISDAANLVDETRY